MTGYVHANGWDGGEGGGGLPPFPAIYEGVDGGVVKVWVRPRPAGCNWSERRIASTNQYAISMANILT